LPIRVLGSHAGKSKIWTEATSAKNSDVPIGNETGSYAPSEVDYDWNEPRTK
jgi:hypothetical protein